MTAPADALGAALLALKPDGVARLQIAHQYVFSVSMFFEIDGVMKAASSDGVRAPTLAEAFDAADAKRLAMIAKHEAGRDRAAAEFGRYFAEVAA